MRGFVIHVVLPRLFDVCESCVQSPDPSKKLGLRVLATYGGKSKLKEIAISVICLVMQ